MTEPTTAAGRAMNDRWPTDVWLDDILAIEAEARAQGAAARDAEVAALRAAAKQLATAAYSLVLFDLDNDSEIVSGVDAVVRAIDPTADPGRMTGSAVLALLAAEPVSAAPVDPTLADRLDLQANTGYFDSRQEKALLKEAAAALRSAVPVAATGLDVELLAEAMQTVEPPEPAMDIVAEANGIEMDWRAWAATLAAEYARLAAAAQASPAEDGE